MVSKVEITSGKPTLGNLITVANGSVVSADIENQNNQRLMNAVILLFNWIIDSGVELTGSNIFTLINTFQNGIKLNYLESLTGSSDVILRNGTFKYGGTGAGNEIATEDYVTNAISTAGSISLNYSFGGLQTGNFNAIKGFVYLCNTTGGAFTGTLPASPAQGDLVGFVDITGTFGANNLTIGRNGSNIMNLAENLICNTSWQPAYLMYETTRGWTLI